MGWVVRSVELELMGSPVAALLFMMIRGSCGGAVVIPLLCVFVSSIV